MQGVTVRSVFTHYRHAVQALMSADRDWLSGLITRRVPVESWSEALEHSDGDIKTIIEFSQI
jgi:glucose 1-dehydrogenase